MNDDKHPLAKNRIRKKSKLSTLSNILPKVVEGLGLDKRLHEQTLMCMWSALVDPVYVSRSRPLYVDVNGILIIAVQDSSTAQELSFAKAKLLDKLKTISSSLGLRIEGLRFDLKRFHGQDQAFLDISEGLPKTFESLMPNEEQLKEIVLSDSHRLEIDKFKEEMLMVAGNLIENENNLENSNLHERIIELVERRLRLQEWHKKMALPYCSRCREPLFYTNISLCRYCAQQEGMQS